MKVTNKQILKAFEGSGGVVSTVAETLSVSRQLIYNRLKDSSELREAKEQAIEEGIDIAESMLIKKIKDGCITSTIFFLKTRGKRRGYTEKMEHREEANSNRLSGAPLICFSSSKDNENFTK